MGNSKINNLPESSQPARNNSQHRTSVPACGRGTCLDNGFFVKIESNSWHFSCKTSCAMETQKVKSCFTITFTDDQYSRAKAYVDEMKKHPQRVFWRGKEGKSEQELVVEQIAHRILSGFYNNEPYEAGKHILRMDSMATA